MGKEIFCRLPQIKEEGESDMDFGFFKGLPYKNSIENFEDYKKYKNINEP